MPDQQATLAEALARTLVAIRRTGRRRAEPRPALIRLTPSQLELVRLLRHRPGLSISEVATELHLAANTVSTLVRDLTRSGVLRRRGDATDRRRARIELVPGVSEILDAAPNRADIDLARAIEALSHEDQNRIASALPALGRLGEVLARPGGATPDEEA